MFGDLTLALRRGLFRGWIQITFWRHTYSPLSPWKERIDEIEANTLQEAARYDLAGVSVDRRRAYQVARMLSPNRHGHHLVDLVPDAHLIFNPPSAATFHSGKRTYASRAQRLANFRNHVQTLAYLLTPTKMARLGIGDSPPGSLVVIQPDEESIDQATVLDRLRSLAGSRIAESMLQSYADVLVRLSRGLCEDEPEEAEAA